MQHPWFVLHVKVVFLQLQNPPHEAGSGTTLHGVTHRVKPAESSVVDDEAELSAPEIRTPVLDRLHSCKQLDLGDRVAHFMFVEATTVVGYDALATFVITLAEDTANAFGDGCVSLDDEFSIEARSGQNGFGSDGVNEALHSRLTFWGLRQRRHVNAVFG